MDTKKLIIIGWNKLAPCLPDKLFLKGKFYLRMGYIPNLGTPKTFQEKLQWLKLNNKKPIFTNMVDKYEAKKFVAELIGEKHIIPTIGVWDKVEDIPWEKLPEKFVIKPTHDSGGLVICKDKAKLDIEQSKKKLQKALKHDYYITSREWPYKNVKKRIIAEELLEDDKHSVDGSLNDYKFYCFNGKVTYCEVITGRYTKKAIDFFDLNWNHVDFCFDGYQYSDTPIKKPELFGEMIEVVGKLCKGLPYSRIDVYCANGNVYFGEITFFPASGCKGFYPKEWNLKLGDMIDLKMV